jgi:hypothetical protein
MEAMEYPPVIASMVLQSARHFQRNIQLKSFGSVDDGPPTDRLRRRSFDRRDENEIKDELDAFQGDRPP